MGRPGVLQFRVPTGLSVSGVTVYSPSFHKAVSVRPPGHGYWSVVYSSAPLVPPPPTPPPADPVPAPDSPIPVLPPPPSRRAVTGPADAGLSPTAAAAEAATAVVDAAAGVPPPVERTASWLAQWRAGMADGTVPRSDLARSLRHPRRGRGARGDWCALFAHGAQLTSWSCATREASPHGSVPGVAADLRGRAPGNAVPAPLGQALADRRERRDVPEPVAAGLRTATAAAFR